MKWIRIGIAIVGVAHGKQIFLIYVVIYLDREVVRVRPR